METYSSTIRCGLSLTNLIEHTPKGVIVNILDDEDMPVDEAGNRADVIMDAASVISRMNLAKPFEHYFTSAIRDVAKDIVNVLGLGPSRHEKLLGKRIEGMSNEVRENVIKLLNAKPHITLADLEQMNPKVVAHAYAHLMRFYQITSDKQYHFYANVITDQEKLEALLDVINKGIYLYYPIDNNRVTIEVVEQLEKAFHPTYGPVSYVGDSGQRITTTENVRIAPLYIMLLDKIADDWSAVATGKLQHFGVLSPTTKSEKFSSPHRNSPVRTIGETEGRIFAGYCGREAIAEMMDRSNSPATQRNITWNILNAKQPTNIEHVVDRSYLQYGLARPLQLVRHIMSTAGYDITYEPEDVV